MKRILITGRNSYIGESLEKWCAQYSGQYTFRAIDMHSDIWRKQSFSGFDAVVHVAGIAHVSTSRKVEELYYKVNRDLAVETAAKAKADGVRQFIFLSSIKVYGNCSSITEVSVPKPNSVYGISKLQAEKGILSLADSTFKAVVLRLPMVYGRGSKGNYPRMAKLALVLPFFPDMDNRRSMIHVDNLCELIRLMVENEDSGIFCPQNSEYVNTAEMVRFIAEVHGKKIRLTRVFNPLLRLLVIKIGMVNKAFGSLVYDKQMSVYKDNYQLKSLEESIAASEN